MSDSEELMQAQDKIEAYNQLRARTDALGYASVNHALDALVDQRHKDGDQGGN
jgi:uncharacterized iron-regulated protein